MASFLHIPVLLAEAVHAVAPAPGRLVLDATLGAGGHSEAFLERGARVVAVDRDPAAVEAARARLSRFGDRFDAVQADFRDARAVLDARGIGLVDALMADLGVSSPQLDDPSRGFSFSHKGPLDMRMDPGRGPTLLEWLRETPEREVARVVAQWGEEPAAKRIARRVKQAVADGEAADTAALAQVVEQAAGRGRARGVHPATRTFQALRMAVNDEPGALSSLMDALPALVAPGGRACFISFHSGEDRPVKRRLAGLSKGCVCPPDLPVCGCGRTAGWRLVTRRAIVASEAETEANPRARSARLRCVERLAS